MKTEQKTNQELFTHHLIQSGYIIKATQAGYKLYNTITGQIKPYSDLSTLYARFTGGDVWNVFWQGKLEAALPLVELEEFNPRAPQGMNGDTLNTFKTFTPRNTPAGSLNVWDEYLSRMFPVAEDRENVLDYIAHIVQKPWQRAQYALVLSGDKGCGKSSFGDLCNALLAGQYRVYRAPGDMTSKHETGITHSLMCVIDDYGKPINAELMKNVITTRYQNVEEKFKQSSLAQAYARIMIFTNYKQPFDNVDDQERRYYAPAYITHKENQQETMNWLSDVWGEWLDTGGVEAIYNSLSERDISGFSSAIAPASTLVDSWRVDDLKESIEDFLADTPVITVSDCAARLEVTLQAAGKLLREAGYVQFVKVLGRKTPTTQQRIYSRLSKEKTIEFMSKPF